MQVEKKPKQLFPKQDTPVEELERMLEELMDIRIRARRLTKSGHPGVRAEALRFLANAEDDIRWLKTQLSKEQ
jgi:hypothetical protein